MKLILILSLVLVVQLLRPVAGAWPLANLDNPTILWIAVSALAISRMGGDRDATQVRRANPAPPNALRDSSFSTSFLSPDHPLQ